MSGLKIIYEDIAIGAKADSTPSANTMPYADVMDLKNDDNVTQNYALCLPYYSKLDGRFINVPDTTDWKGWVSQEVSDDYSMFETDPEITILFDNTYSCVGLSFVFNEFTNDYPQDIYVDWYNGSTKLAQSAEAITNVKYFLQKIVTGFNKIVISFTLTSITNRPVFISRLDFGLLREYHADSIENPVAVMELSQVGEILPISTLDFTIIDNSGVGYMFQNNQAFSTYWDDTLISKTYLDNGYKTSKGRYVVKTMDAIKVLDSQKWYGGMYNNYSLTTLLAAIFTDTKVEYQIATSLSATTITGYMPITTKREALEHIALAIGAIVDTSFSDKVKIYPVPTTVTQTITDTTVFDEPTITYGANISGFDLTCHSYSELTDTETLYNSTLSGSTTVTFGAPYHTLTITGGTITKSNCNYAIITGTGSTVTLTGQKYKDIQTVLSYRNTTVRGKVNIPSVESATLINPTNGPTTLTRLRTYYETNDIANVATKLDNFKIGEKTCITAGDESKTGILQKATLRFGANYIKANVEVR